MRGIDGRDVFWLANNEEQQSQACEIDVPGVHGAASIWDCETGRNQSGSLRGHGFRQSAVAGVQTVGGLLVVFDPKRPATSTLPAELKERDVAGDDGPWTLTYDASIQPVMEHPKKPPAESRGRRRRKRREIGRLSD